MAVDALTENRKLVGLPGRKSFTYRSPIRVGRYVSAASAMLAGAIIVNILASSPAAKWPRVATYFIDPLILEGVGKTIVLTFAAMAIAVVVGIALAIMRRSTDPSLRAVSWVYVYVMRSIPVLVLILFTYFLAVLLPRLSFGIPFGGPKIWSVDTNSVISPFTASVIALGLAQAAYTSEIIRGGLLAVDRGQVEAAMSVGMTSRQSFWRVVLPQAFRVIVPGLGNESIGMLKATSLVQIIGYTELLTTAQRIYSMNFATVPLLIVVTAWYMALVAIASFGQAKLEKAMSRGF
ncbi:amino acid ABC transporter permease [Aminobacter sp. MSH1]|uniref:amino acid ABC transporter permease n=1 Tax=Aminobacter sp. MSH1 TaxID=374606 RepID=UPI000D3AFEAC|nr:amino acid ABC transporter permease [Aminobacter sp. MSH1]